MASGFSGVIGSAIGSALASSIQNIAGAYSTNGSETRLNKEDTNWLHTLQSNYWRNDTQWYNDNIVASAYQRARQSLERAGYNPLMALNNGGLYDQAPMTQGMSQDTHSSAKSYNASMQRLTDAQKENINADTDLKASQTRLTSAQETTEIFKQENMAIDKELKEIDKQLKNTELKYMDKKALLEMKNLYTQAQLNLTKAYTTGIMTTSNIKLNSAKELEAKEKINRDSWSVSIPGFKYSREGKWAIPWSKNSK